MSCGAKMRPFRPIPDSEFEIECELGDTIHEDHVAVIRDYAYPGSETAVKWMDNDRRTFYGEFEPCDEEGCFLPNDHRRDHAYG